MAYDERLAERIRSLMAGRGDVVERRMFGSAVFMVGGNMACAAMGDGLLARLGEEGVAAALAEPHTRPTEMGTRTMKGYLLVGEEGIESDAELEAWVGRAVAFAEGLPAR